MLSIPFETIYPAEARTAVLEKIMTFFNNAVSISPTPNIVKTFTLFQNYPNPFNPVTTIRYRLSAAGMVHLNLYNALGQKVSVLVHARQKAGIHRFRFDGSQMAAGVYYYRLQSGSSVQTGKMVLLR